MVKLTKKQKRIIISILILFGIVFLGFYFSGEKKSSPGTISILKPLASYIPPECAGTSVLDIDSVDVSIGEEPGFNRYIKILASTMPTAGADCIAIQFEKDELNKKLKEGDAETKKYSATKDTSYGYLKLDKFTRSWSINPTFDSISYAFSRQNKDFCGMICSVSNCKDELGTTGVLDGNYIGAVWASTDYKNCGIFYDPCLCVYPYERAKKGIWSTTAIDYRKVTFGITGLGSVSSEGYPNIPAMELKDSFGNKKALIRWKGDIGSGINYQISGYAPIKSLSNQVWYFLQETEWNYLRSMDSYSNYESIKNSIKSCSVTSTESCIDPKIENREINFQRFPEISSYNLRKLVTDENAISGASISATNLVLELTKQPPSFPQFVILLDAEWAGIKLLTTIPEVQCTQPSAKIISGSKVNVNVNVLNKGNMPGSITANVECDSGVQGSISPSGFSLEAKSSATGIVQIGGIAVGGDVFGDCKVKVVDSVDPNLKDDCVIKVQIVSAECDQPGLTQCSPDFEEVWTCKSDGQWNIIACAYGCKDGKCNDRPNPDCPQSCQKDSECDPCGKNYVCSNNKCIEKPPIMDCNNCFSWLYSKAKKDYCKPSIVYDFKLGDIFGWDAGPVLFKIDQNTYCPLILAIILIFGLTILLLITAIIMNLKNKRRRRRR